MEYRKRLLEPYLLEIGQYFPVIALTGARQVGKTTLLKHLLPQAKHITFDPVIDVGNARRDPELFLDQLNMPVILDEIQYAPELLPVIKRRVDENHFPGQYWLTGSQNLSLIKNISESLAGRVSLLTLEPMTLGERENQPSIWINDYIHSPEIFLRKQFLRIQTTQNTITQLWRGGYPGLVNLPEHIYSTTFESYLKTYIERDVRILSDVSDLHQFSSFVQLLANLTAQEINYSQLGREIGITPQTARRWISLLINTFQWTEISAFHSNTIKRISSKNKGYFIDTGFASHLMHISSPQALMGHPRLGALFETFVIQDILRQLALFKGKPAVYHWRSHGGAEVDLIIEMDNIYYPIEIKFKTRPTRNDTLGIEAFRKTYPKLHTAPGLVICPIPEMIPLANDCFALPYDILM